jgi:hypothetical protein
VTNEEERTKKDKGTRLSKIRESRNKIHTRSSNLTDLNNLIKKITPNLIEEE